MVAASPNAVAPSIRLQSAAGSKQLEAFKIHPTNQRTQRTRERIFIFISRQTTTTRRDHQCRRPHVISLASGFHTRSMVCRRTCDEQLAQLFVNRMNTLSAARTAQVHLSFQARHRTQYQWSRHSSVGVVGCKRVAAREHAQLDRPNAANRGDAWETSWRRYVHVKVTTPLCKRAASSAIATPSSSSQRQRHRKLIRKPHLPRSPLAQRLPPADHPPARPRNLTSSSRQARKPHVHVHAGSSERARGER
jgi:hypothetical protein